jgi:hypothetical protein
MVWIFLLYDGLNQMDDYKATDKFRMNTSYGRYGATYNMVGLSCFNDELLCV